jgi:hypothetical protein
MSKQEGYIKKGWGYELIWASTDNYCGKILVFLKEGNKTSMHFHKKKQTRFIAGDTFNGVGVTILPSLTATDSYHYRHGWVKPHRAAEAYLWSKDKGLSNFMVHSV